MAISDKKRLRFDKKILIIGFGSIGQAVLPLLFRHLAIQSQQLAILTKNEAGRTIAEEYGVSFQIKPVTKENYVDILKSYLHTGDFLLNLSVNVSSHDLMAWCQKHQVLYLDTCIEPWEGGYTNKNLSVSERSNYALREAVRALSKGQEAAATALVTHGANPGLVSHLVKQALLNMANDTGISDEIPRDRLGWAKLAQKLNIKTIHIAERDTQVGTHVKQANEFVNTWSIDGFVSEGCQPAELGWGSHERHWPSDGGRFDFGQQCAIYLNRPGAATKVRTWTPLAGAFHGFLITHAEAISIASYLTIENGGNLQYRPTVHYAYHPCDDAILSLHELAGREWVQQDKQTLLLSDITSGIDELGVLLMGNSRGAYWFGSQLSIQEARKLVPHNNATSLQVAISVLAGMMWVIEHPTQGIVEPDQIDYRYILDIATPYLGTLTGVYTEWTPLAGRESLFPETIDSTDPWQFLNVRIV